MIEPTPVIAEPTVRITFVPTVDDLVHASQETVRGSGRRRWMTAAATVIFVVIVVARLVEGGFAELLGSSVYLVAVLVVLAVAHFGVPLIVRWAVVRQRRQNPHFAGPVTYTFTADGVHLQTPLGVSDMPWTSFVRARETPQQILLFFGHQTSYFVPRRALREDDERRLKAWLAARLGPNAELTNESTGR